MAFIPPSIATLLIFRLAVVDTAGTGVIATLGNGGPECSRPACADDLLHLWRQLHRVAGPRRAAERQLLDINVSRLQQKFWQSLRKCGTNYYSWVWAPESTALVWAGTVDRVGMLLSPLGTIGGSDSVIDIDWFNKIA